MVAFEIVYVLNSTLNAKGLVARLIAPDAQFELTSNSRLGKYEIYPWLSQPRALDNEGNPRFDLFIFSLKNGNEYTHFSEGDVVHLTDYTISEA